MYLSQNYIYEYILVSYSQYLNTTARVNAFQFTIPGNCRLQFHFIALRGSLYVRRNNVTLFDSKYCIRKRNDVVFWPDVSTRIAIVINPPLIFIWFQNSLLLTIFVVFRAKGFRDLTKIQALLVSRLNYPCQGKEEIEVSKNFWHLNKFLAMKDFHCHLN